MADTKLSALSSGSAIADADLSYWAQGGNSVKQAASALATYLFGKVSGDGTISSGGALAVTAARFPQTLGQSHIPFVLLSSGTMGNNGAISLLSGAVATAYPNAYVYLPALAIAATGPGSAAGWYYAVFSSTTALTVYNNTYTSGTPAIPGTPTAFSTTGPGAYVQTTGSSIAAYTLTIAGNVIGANGSLYTIGVRTYNNSAGAKTLQLNYGAFAFGSAGPTATLDQAFLGGISNRGVTNVQVPLGQANLGLAASASPLLFGSVDSTTSQSFIAYLQLATATDTITLENILVQLIPGVP